MQPRITEALAGLPAPSVDRVLIRVAIQSYLATAHLKPKVRARAFLDEASRILADEESAANIIPVRPASDRAALSRARREAIAWFEAMYPTLRAVLPPDDISPDRPRGTSPKRERPRQYDP